MAAVHALAVATNSIVPMSRKLHRIGSRATGKLVFCDDVDVDVFVMLIDRGLQQVAVSW
jgi:hypothetical protein